MAGFLRYETDWRCTYCNARAVVSVEMADACDTIYAAVKAAHQEQSHDCATQNGDRGIRVQPTKGGQLYEAHERGKNQ